MCLNISSASVSQDTLASNSGTSTVYNCSDELLCFVLSLENWNLKKSITLELGEKRTREFFLVVGVLPNEEEPQFKNRGESGLISVD